MDWRKVLRVGASGSAASGEKVAEADRLRSERDDVREILDHMLEGVAVIEPDGEIRLANPAFEEFYPSAPAAKTSEKLLLELSRVALEQGGSPIRDVISGPPVERHLTLVASRLPSGNGVVLVARDVTETVRLAESRKDLVANVSHELKTPLTAIRGYAETLRDGALAKPPTARRFTEQILGQCGRLEALLGDLLTLSKIESQPSPLDALEPVDLGQLIGGVVEVLASRARAQEVSLQCDLPELSPRVRGDAAELERLFLNLLENAIKYNRPGGEVHLRLIAEDGHARVDVKDTGIGIPPEARERIFERFYRVDKGRARDEGGTGLGLAIVKHAVRRHGGDLEVTSTLGKGSTFTIRLPLAAP